MRLENYSIEKLKKQVLDILGKYLDLKQRQVFFFGSRVTGAGDNRSDIDIGIEGKEPIPLEILSKIKEDVDQLNILYKIEIVDFTKVDPKFKKVALKHCEPLT